MSVAPGGGDPHFTPFTVAPQLRNRDAVAAALERESPPALRAAQAGGRVDVWSYIDEAGTVSNARVQKTSGRPELDTAALRVARAMAFSPAMNCDRAVRVWVSIPITFRPR